jgi:hypothetical protein
MESTKSPEKFYKKKLVDHGWRTGTPRRCRGHVSIERKGGGSQ